MPRCCAVGKMAVSKAEAVREGMKGRGWALLHSYGAPASLLCGGGWARTGGLSVCHVALQLAWLQTSVFECPAQLMFGFAERDSPQ